MKKFRSYLKKNKRFGGVALASGGVVFVGLIALFIAAAATPALLVEVGLSNVTSPAVIVDDPSASSGKALQFQAAGSTPPPPTSGGGSTSGFVTRQGRDLMLDGKVWKFVGVNNFSLTGCHHGQYPDQAEVDGFFASLRPKSMTRVWAFEMQGEDGIARTVAAAEKHNQKVMFTFADGAEFCGSPDFKASWYENDYKGEYFQWISTITQKYKNSPAVGAWEIMNEPALKADGLSQSTMKSFFDTTAAHIKANDPNHLVSTGTLAPWQSEFEGASGYADVHSGPNIDMISVHEYDYAYQNSRTIISPHFGTAKEAADQVNKPVFIGETGIVLPDGCVSAAERASALKQKFDGYLGGGASGVLYWAVLSAPNNGGEACNKEHANNDPPAGAVMDMIRNYQIQ